MGTGGLLRASDLDFSELTRGSQQLKISRADRRGITFDQLKKLLVFLKKRCDEHGAIRGWYDPKTGEKLHYRTITLKQLQHWVIQPVTERRQCSYVEAISKDAASQLPAWVVGHTWDEPFVDFVRRAMKHGTLGAGDAFWAAPFSSRLDDCSQLAVPDSPDGVIDFQTVTNLRVCLSGSLKLKSIEELGQSLPQLRNLSQLDLDLSGSPALSVPTGLGEGVWLRSLSSLRLSFTGSTGLRSLQPLCESLTVLGSHLVALEVRLGMCSSLLSLGGESEGCCFQGLQALRSLKVEASGCSSLKSIDVVSEKMKMLKSLELDVSGCSSLTSLDGLSRNLGKLSSLKAVDLRAAGCGGLRSLGHLGSSLSALTALSALRLDFSGCSALEVPLGLREDIDKLRERCTVNIDFSDCDLRLPSSAAKPKSLLQL
ncbi:unnamed protein product [Polarella glacialis]|uniref:Uncharacterized protein n=1 Tax=Polarella glacialis TaxID=89957 RepID=A0A813FSU3_POLGL|nr:unnamed protein product [Polarella glacialis]